MHIAYLTPEYPHSRMGPSGGMGTSIKNLVNALVKIGVQVTVFVYGQSEDAKFEECGILFYLIQLKHFPVGGFFLYRKHINRRLNELIDNEKIDLIEAPDWTGITAFMKFRIPLIIRFHGSDTYFCHLEGRTQKWKNRFFEKQAMKRATSFIAPTHYAGRLSARLFHLPADKVQTIHYGLKLDKFQNESPKNYAPYQILNIGTLIRKKGVFQLIEMFNKVIEKFPEATLVLIGNDSSDIKTGTKSTWELMRSRLTSQALKKVTYMGKVPYDEVQRIIKKAHVCVFPSLAETLGMVTIESMALNKVVVNTNLGWAQDILTHQVDGYMHHPEYIEEYVATIGSVFENSDLVLSIGQAARKKIENTFDIHKIAKQNIEFYTNVIASC